MTYPIYLQPFFSTGVSNIRTGGQNQPGEDSNLAHWMGTFMFYNLSPVSHAKSFLLFSTAFLYRVEKVRHTVEIALLFLILGFFIDLRYSYISVH